MTAKETYTCENCGKQVELAADESNVPECCDQVMVPKSSLPVCEAPVSAESSRMDDMGEPCDDGRAG
ncbi:MAG: hypothetical protein JRH15_07980 [Deltaproteobacteria bacterium]|nr:hypothetical protein [Deltaproteobacteria bacterium]